MRNYHIVCSKTEKYFILDMLRKCGMIAAPSSYGDMVYIAIRGTEEQAAQYEKMITN